MYDDQLPRSLTASETFNISETQGLKNQTQMELYQKIKKSHQDNHASDWTILRHTPLNSIISIAVSPCGMFVVFGGLELIQTLNIPLNQLDPYLETSYYLKSVYFSPNGSFLLCGYKKFLEILDFKQKTLYSKIPTSSDRPFTAIFTADGNFVVYPVKKSLVFWSFLNKSEEFKFNGHENVVLSLACSADGRFIISGSLDKSMIVWNFKSKRQEFKLISKQKQVTIVNISNNGVYAAGIFTSFVTIWNLDEKCEVLNLNCKEKVYSMSFSPDNQNLAVSVGECYIYLINIMSKRIEKIFYDEISVGFKVAFSIDGKILIRETICLWNISKIPKQSIFFHNIDSGDGNNVLVTNNKKYLGLSSSQGLKIFNTEKNQIEFILSEFKENVYDVWIAQEIYLITLGDRNLSVFNLKTNDIIFSFINNKGQNLRFLVSHDLFAIFYTNDTFCSVWSIIENIRVFDINRGNIRILHSSFIRNSRSLVFIFEDRYIGIWNIDSECEEYSLKDQYKSIHKIYYLIDQKSFIIDVINNNSKRVAYFWNFQGNSEELPIYSYKFIWINQKYIITDNNNILTIWNIKGKFKEFEVDYQTKPENISYNGKFLFMIYNTHSDIWKIQDYQKFQLNNLYKLNVPIFSSNDKKYVVSGDENFLKLWNLEQGKEILSFKAHENWIRTLAFSHDNKFIVSGDDNGSVKIWDLKGKNIQCFKGHSSWVVAASFSRNGRFVVSGSNDRIVLVWEVGRDEELKAFEVYQEAIHSVSITDNGKFIAVESIKGDLRVLKG